MHSVSISDNVAEMLTFRKFDKFTKKLFGKWIDEFDQNQWLHYYKDLHATPIENAQTMAQQTQFQRYLNKSACVKFKTAS